MKGLDVYRRCLALMGYTAEDDEVLTEKSLVTRMPELINFIADEIGVPAIEKLSDEIKGTAAQREAIVAGSAMLLKNAVGLGGVIVIFATFAVPLLKMWALSLAFRLTAAFTAPVSEKRVSESLRKLGDCVDMLFSSVASMGTIMIIAIASIL